MSLVGKLAMISGSDFYRKVEILDQITPEIYRVKDIDVPEGQFGTSGIFHIGVMLTNMEADGSLDQSWFIFDTKDELEAWVVWLETVSPDNETKDNKVITFKKK